MDQSFLSKIEIFLSKLGTKAVSRLWISLIQITQLKLGTLIEDLSLKRALELEVFGRFIFYEGTIYGTEIVRGLDVFKLTESEFLTQADIESANNAFPAVGPKRLFNPQQQMPMTWPKVSSAGN